MTKFFSGKKNRIMVFGIGSFAHAAIEVLAAEGAEVSCYLTRDYGHFGPNQVGETYSFIDYPNPCALLKKKKINLVVPMSIDWHYQDWTTEFLQLGIPILSPIREAMLIERDRDFAHKLCKKYGIPFPISYVAKNRPDALEFLEKHPKPYVIKNPLCSPSSPVHTIVCENVADTKSWLSNVDYAEGVFLQEYLGRREVGHIAFIANGEIIPMVTNQEYKRAFDGNMGPVAGAPLGGLIEADLDDKYGLVEDLIKPLQPWFQKTNFYGPIQVTAVQRDRKWYVIEYNVRTGVTTGPALWRMLENPAQVIMDVANNKKPQLIFKKNMECACTLTLAGWGYPYTRVVGPYLTVQLQEKPTCDIWWNEVKGESLSRLFMSGHRIADIIAHGPTMDEAITRAYENIKKIYCLASYYRLDVGQSLWPPGND